MKEEKYKTFKKSLGQDTHSAIVFLCTPRCGTQWLSKNLGELYSDQAVTLHEPIENEYNPKENLGVFDTSSLIINDDLLNKHYDFIDEVTQRMQYIEVSWQTIAGIAEFYQRFPDRLRIIHMYRNPVKVAASLMTHNWYTGKIKVRSEKAELTPFDRGASLTDYKESWENLTLFEKSLYYWTEINLRALEIKHRYPSLPFYSLKFEDLFEERKEIQRIILVEMLSFMGLRFDDKVLKALSVPCDKYQNKTPKAINWKDIFNHPQTIALAEKLGYTFDAEINLKRYKYPLPKKILHRIKTLTGTWLKIFLKNR